MKVKLKSPSLFWMDKAIYEKLAEGWKVIKEPKKNIWGKWICRMEKL